MNDSVKAIGPWLLGAGGLLVGLAALARTTKLQARTEVLFDATSGLIEEVAQHEKRIATVRSNVVRLEEKAMTALFTLKQQLGLEEDT